LEQRPKLTAIEDIILKSTRELSDDIKQIKNDLHLITCSHLENKNAINIIDLTLKTHLTEHRERCLDIKENKRMIITPLLAFLFGGGLTTACISVYKWIISNLTFRN